MTAQALAEQLEVSERTIYRDIESLSMAGIPLYTERGPGGGCELLDGYQTKLTGLTIAEIRALFLSGNFNSLTDLGLNQVLEDALLKLSAALPATSRIQAEQVRQRIHIDTTQSTCSSQIHSHLELIQEALWQDCTLQLTYGYSQRNIDPYGLVSKAGTWYLIGASAGTLQVVRVPHIQSIQLTQHHFTRPNNFDLVAYWDQHVALTSNRSPMTGRGSRIFKKTILKTNQAAATPQKATYPTSTPYKKKTSLHLHAMTITLAPIKKTQNDMACPVYSAGAPWNLSQSLLNPDQACPGR
ncbi:hypothetical protein KDH_07260 [Dictyobacter sp. S3.2.2.5]|uniref:HTH deoR-type domain-containing protein n=2 Tax=Dictyobacter halimunensis TaxID=3026934 RepID=A0ABQ6FLG8_9CHLR|nr:hypothetical protein KDH_07260 [Dictyobacter sp. S3.2.2.5]